MCRESHGDATGRVFIPLFVFLLYPPTDWLKKVKLRLMPLVLQPLVQNC